MNKPLTTTDATFERDVLQSGMPVLVDFWASWCPPCVATAPIVEQLASEYADKATIAKLSVEENQAIPAQYHIRSIPTLMIFYKGEVKETLIGFQSKAALAAKLDAILATNS